MTAVTVIIPDDINNKIGLLKIERKIGSKSDVIAEVLSEYFNSNTTEENRKLADENTKLKGKNDELIGSNNELRLEVARLTNDLEKYKPYN
jgi:predicted nuclease with TOPRIM domain